MSARSIAVSPPFAAAGARNRVGRREFALACAYYLLGALALTMFLWRDPASRVVTGNPYDTDQFAWFFRYDATAVAHLHLPDLITSAMNAPQGVSVMWNTFMLLPGVLLAPVTLLAGPQVSVTVLLTLGFAGSAAAMFYVLRRWGVRGMAAAFGGLAYGFAPALVQCASGHYDLQFAVLPPLIVDAALRLATGRARGPVRGGIYLGLVVAAQVFIAEELLFDSAIFVVVAIAVLAVSRPRLAAGRVRDVAIGVACGLGLTLVIAGYPLWVQFFGPLRAFGSPFAPDYFKNDLAGFVQPASSMFVHTAASAAFAARYQGELPEYLGYLGWPMIIVLILVAVRFWRMLPVRVLTVAFIVLATFSLGGTLLAGGHEHQGIELPWYWLQTLPLTGSVIPDRFSICADGAAAAMFAYGIDAARVRWPHWLVLTTALVAIAPIVPRPLPAGSPAPPPAGWTAAFDRLALPRGASVLLVPIPISTFTLPLRWQAVTGQPSSMVGGYFIGPAWNGGAYIDGNGLSGQAQYLNDLWAGGPVSAPPSNAAVLAQLSSWHPAAVVAVTSVRSELGTYLTALLGKPSVAVGGVLAWRRF